MQKDLSVRMLMWSSVFSCLSATAMAVSLALLIVYRSGYDLISMCVIKFDLGLRLLPPPMWGFLCLVSRPYNRSLVGSIFGCVFWFGVLLCLDVGGTASGCWCMI
jgi:hypothetical protein